MNVIVAVAITVIVCGPWPQSSTDEILSRANLQKQTHAPPHTHTHMCTCVHTHKHKHIIFNSLAAKCQVRNDLHGKGWNDKETGRASDHTVKER